MDVFSDSTVAALATPPGTGGVAVIRISGAQAWPVAAKIFPGRKGGFQPGRVHHGWIVDPERPDNPLDEVLLLAFKAPASYTGEDVVEIHCHGGDYLSRRILDLCFRVGARPAGPGEFTRRAYLNGRMDLTQAESVLDLISAQGDRLLSAASRNLLHRTLGRRIEILARELEAIQADIVASIDFPDEVDEPDRTALSKRLRTLLAQAMALEAASQGNRMARTGFQVALLGLPNAGKSSLFNALLARDRSIVTETAGTTRDVITETLPIRGVPVTLMDTAGIRDGGSDVEALGIARTWEAAADAQAVLYVYDARLGLTGDDQDVLVRLPRLPSALVANKMDRLNSHRPPPADHLPLCALSGEGLPNVYGWLESLVDRPPTDPADQDLVLNRRQLDCVGTLCQNLEQALVPLENPALPLDLVTVPLTDALREMDGLLGRDTSEEVLTRVFSQFCVGK